MTKQEDSQGLTRILEYLIFIFATTSFLIRPLVSSIRAETSGPMASWAFTYGLIYGRYKSANFLAWGILFFFVFLFFLLAILRGKLRLPRTNLEWPLFGFGL